jgi:non-specific serine/threonine protein kinase
MSGAPDTWPLSAREAAAVLGVHERTIRRAIARGELEASKHGGAYQISRDDLERLRLRRTGAVAMLPALHGETPRLIALHDVHRPPAIELPHPLTSFIGRAVEIDIVRDLIISSEVRLVTLTGPGGVGKTRLAIAAARAAAEAFDQVRFVSLAAVREDDRVESAIVQALGLREEERHSLEQRVGPALRERSTLLVVDNFEQVVDASPLLIDLLTAFPDLTVLTTSRMRLRLSGEHEVVVPPLGLDPVENDEELAISPASTLLIARAQAMQPAFDVTTANAATIEAICRRLDGLPLAIELAAVRFKVVTPDVLLARLEQRLNLLTGGNRDSPTRQQTMRDTIAWSYELITPAEQALFRYLSVFVGGFSLGAVDHVAAAIGIRDGDALAALAALVDASLLRSDGAPVGQPRYFMLETVREYGQELLEAMGETRAARDAHAAYFHGLGSWLDPNVIAPGVTFDDRLREIELEQPNLEAALAHMAEIGNARGMLHLAGQCAIFWHHRSYLGVGRRWLEYALAEAPAEPTIQRGVALAGLSLILWTQVEPERAAQLAEEALAIGRTLADAHLMALSLHLLGIAATLELRWPKAKLHMEEALSLWPLTGERSSEAMALMVLSEIEYGLGAVDRSLDRANEALPIFESIGHHSGAAFTLVRIGRVAHRQHDVSTALGAYQDALRLWVGIGDQWGSVKALVGLAEIGAISGQYGIAAELVGVIDARVADRGASVFPVDVEHVDRATAILRSALGERQLAEHRAAGRARSPEEALELAMSVRVGDHPRATRDPFGLSRRETEVLRLLVEGRSNAEIADHLYIGVRTVRSHVANIFAKMDVTSRTAAASHALRNNLV